MSALRELVGSRRDEITEAVRRHNGRTVAVFGSVARGDDGPDSDIDFLVEFEDGSSLFDLLHISGELEELLEIIGEASNQLSDEFRAALSLSGRGRAGRR